MKQLFVDTSAWAAIADSNDPNHNAALLFKDQIATRYQLVVTNYIWDELYTLLLMNVGYRYTVTFKRQLDLLIDNGIIETIWVSTDLAARSWAIFERFNVDKRWSFTDCTSYAAMKRLGIQEVFAFDHHFEQMGFIRKP